MYRNKIELEKDSSNKEYILKKETFLERDYKTILKDEVLYVNKPALNLIKATLSGNYIVFFW